MKNFVSAPPKYYSGWKQMEWGWKQMDWTWWEKMSIAFRKWGRYNGFKVEGKKNYQKTTKIFGRGGKSRKYMEYMEKIRLGMEKMVLNGGESTKGMGYKLEI